MPSTRGQAQRVALETASAHNAAAHPLTPELIELIVNGLPLSDLAAVRLASKQFATAVDPLIQTVSINTTGSNIKAASLHVPSTWLQHVCRANVSSSWKHVRALVQQLPQLRTLLLASHSCKPMPRTLAASLVHLTRLDVADYNAKCLPAPTSGVQLPGLRALSAGEANHNSIAAFAPQLQELYCRRLRLTPASSAPLPACTHFGAWRIDLQGSVPTAGVLAAFSCYSTAFPMVQVVSSAPHCWPPIMSAFTGSFLRQLPCLRAARVSSAMRLSGDDDLLQGLTNLQRLSAHITYANEAEDICSLTQLQHLQLQFSAYDLVLCLSADLLEGLGRMQQLVTLELPAWLLCQECATLAASDGDELDDPAEEVAAAADAARLQQGLRALAASSSLQSLTFLIVNEMDECDHGNELAAAVASLLSPSTADTAAAAQQGQQQRQPVRVQLRTVEDDMWSEAPHTYTHDSSSSVWGVYGPPDW